MEAVHKFTNQIKYDLTVTYAGEIINIMIDAVDFRTVKRYKKSINGKFILQELK